MQKVWRIEHAKTRQGPYTGDTRYYHQTSSDRHPSPNGMPERGTPLNRIFRDLNGEHLVFGFKSKSQAADWFHTRETRASLQSHGFVLRQYEAREVVEGNFQIAFDRGEMLDELPVTALDNPHHTTNQDGDVPWDELKAWMNWSKDNLRSFQGISSG